MKSFYATISISSMAHQGERFNIGLFASDGERIFFHYSEQKLKILAKLFSKSALELVKSSLKSINNAVHEFESKDVQPDALVKSQKDFKHLSASYFDYLNRYNNNLVQFSKPKQIDLEINQTIFRKLFHTFIYESERFETNIIKKQTNFEREYTEFLASAAKYVNTNFKVTKELISRLATPKTVDMFGKNGSFNLAHSIDFQNSSQTLIKNIDAYLCLAYSAELTESKHAKCFILGEEPAKNSKNHTIWSDVRDLKEITYVPFNERTQILDHFEKEGVTPIFNE